MTSSSSPGRCFHLRSRRHVKDTVPECAEADARVADLGAVTQSHAQEANVIDDGSRDGRDHQKDRGHEQQEDADPIVRLVCAHCLFMVAW